MPRYEFTDASGRIFTDLSHGVAGTVVDPGPDVDGNPGAAPPVGSTVLLEPGDHLVTAEPYEHCYLREVDAQPASAKTPVEVANTSRSRIPTQATPAD